MKSNKGFILLIIYMFLTFSVSLAFGERGMYWLPIITLMLIAVYESIKWRRKAKLSDSYHFFEDANEYNRERKPL